MYDSELSKFINVLNVAKWRSRYYFELLYKALDVLLLFALKEKRGRIR